MKNLPEQFDLANAISICGSVRRLQIGQAMPFAREQASAINKESVDHVNVTMSGFVGDEQADQSSEEQAVVSTRMRAAGAHAAVRSGHRPVPPGQ